MPKNKKSGNCWKVSFLSSLQKGIVSFTNFLISGHFRIEEAITAGAKAAYLAAKIMTGDKNPLTKYTDEDISTMEISNQHWKNLNRLKKLQDKSAFFYWYQALSLLGLVKEPVVEANVQKVEQVGLEEMEDE